MTKKNEELDQIHRSTSVIMPVDTMFETLVAPDPSRDDLLRLATGVLGAIHIESMFSPSHCADIMRRLDACPMDTYDPQRIFPPVPKFGPTVYDYCLGGNLRDEYWEDVAQATRNWKAAVGEDDPMDQVTAWMARNWEWPVTRATVGGRPLFAGMLREINGGARIHFDEVVRDFPGVLDEVPLAQIGFNCYLSIPEAGGELTVYRRRWQPSDATRRVGYGYHVEIVEGAPTARVRPNVGDGVLFDTRNYHSVEPLPDGRRVALGFFIGVIADRRFIIWS